MQKIENIKAERGVLGACLMHKMCAKRNPLDESIEFGCKPEWFSQQCNREIWRALVEMDAADEEIDIITLGNRLHGPLEGSKGYDLLYEVSDECVSTEHVTGYLHILKDNFLKRAIVDEVLDISDKCHDIDEDPTRIITAATERLSNLIVVQSDKSVADCMEDNITVMENACDGIVSGIPLPWAKFSSRTGGLQIGSSIPFVGRDGKGKSGAIAQCLDFWAGEGIPTLAFTLEDVKRRTLLRMGGCREWYSARAVEMGGGLIGGRFVKHCQAERDILRTKMLKYKDFITEAPFWIIDRPCTVEDIIHEVRKYKRIHGIKVVVIDGFKDIVYSEGSGDTSCQAHIARKLQMIAKECEVAMPVVSHINKIDEGVPISKIHVTGSGEQSKGARQIIIFQDAGIEGVDGINTFALSTNKSNFGGAGGALLRRDEQVFWYQEV